MKKRTRNKRLKLIRKVILFIIEFILLTVITMLPFYIVALMEQYKIICIVIFLLAGILTYREIKNSI